MSRLPRRASALEDTLAWQLHAVGLPEPTREHRFDARRRWRFDFAWPALKLAVEVEGVTYQGGRHQRVAGFAADAEKYNAAAVAGWTVLRFTGAMVRSGEAVRVIEASFARMMAQSVV